MSLLTAFNNIVIDFIDDCIAVIPQEPKFKIYKQAILIFKKYNPRKIPETFKSYLALYRPQIDSKDENFFLNNSFNEVQNLNKQLQIEEEEEEEIFKVINQIKNYWKELSQENRDTIWEYMEVMVKLSDQL